MHSVVKLERDEILKTTFSKAFPVEEPPSLEGHSLKIEATSGVICTSSVQLPEPEIVPALFFQTALPSFLHKSIISNTLPTFSMKLSAFNLLEHLPKELILPTPSKETPPLLLPKPSDVSITLNKESFCIEDTMSLEPSPLSEPIPVDLPKAIAKQLHVITLPNLPKLPTLNELQTSSYSDSFEAELVFLPKETKGYIFALTLIPKQDLDLAKIRQHFTFLIDRSNSIQQGRLSATKTAVHKALEELSETDTFNIIAFDSKIEKMSPYNLPCVGSSFVVAETFLEKVQLGSFFTSSDLYKPLSITVPYQVENDEIYTTILLTDGETLSKKSATKALLQNWTQYNKGKVSLYAIGMSSDAQKTSLETITAFNKGKWMDAPSSRSLKRKLLRLIKTVQNPIAKDLSCKAISKSASSKIQLFAKAHQMPHLYRDQPYVILGETEHLDDFILFVQGRLKDRWLNIKKTISFANAKKGSKWLKEEWALQKAYDLYERYLGDENPEHIAEAAHLLEPFHFKPVF